MTTKTEMATEDFITYLNQRTEDLDKQYHEGQFETPVQASTYELLACPLHRLMIEMQTHNLGISQAEQMLRSLRHELHTAMTVLGRCRIKHMKV